MSTGTNGARAARPGGSGSARLGKYHLRVTARDAVDVVASAGGWLTDRAMAGWDVTVVLTAECDPLPLRILGVDTMPAADDDADGPLRSQSFAASAAALVADDALRNEVTRALRTGVAEVTIWGDIDSDAGRRVVPGLIAVEHRLSSAARAFKARALHAAGAVEDVVGVEYFSSRTSALNAGYCDLTPSAVATSFAQR